MKADEAEPLIKQVNDPAEHTNYNQLNINNSDYDSESSFHSDSSLELEDEDVFRAQQQKRDASITSQGTKKTLNHKMTFVIQKQRSSKHFNIGKDEFEGLIESFTHILTDSDEEEEEEPGDVSPHT